MEDKIYVVVKEVYKDEYDCDLEDWVTLLKRVETLCYFTSEEEAKEYCEELIDSDNNWDNRYSVREVKRG